MKVSELPHRPLVSAPVDATLAHVAELIDRHAVGSVVVVDDGGHPVGIVTDRDLVTRGMARRAPLDARIDSVMTDGVVCVDHEADLDEVATVLSRHAIRRVPVVEGGRVVGVVALDDILVRLADHVQHTLHGLTAQVLFGHAEPRLPATADS